MNSRMIPVRRVILAVAMGLGCGQALAQDPTISFNPRTGDVWVDTRLNDINQYGGGYRDSFINEMVRYHSAPRDLVGELLNRPNWTPGDVYYACALAAQTGRPCRSVADDYDRDRGQGWGAVAQRMGIKPGSPQFHALKRGFVPTYDRWGRPVRIDADLARDFPNRRDGMRHDRTRGHKMHDRTLHGEHPRDAHRHGGVKPKHAAAHGYNRVNAGAGKAKRQGGETKHGGPGKTHGGGKDGGHGKH